MLVVYVSSASVGDNGPLEQLGLLFTPVLLNVTFPIGDLLADFEVDFISFFVFDDDDVITITNYRVNVSRIFHFHRRRIMSRLTEIFLLFFYKGYK